MNDDALEKLRQQIDDIDQKLLELFNRRARCAVEVAEVKRALGDESDEGVNFFRPIFFDPHHFITQFITFSS